MMNVVIIVNFMTVDVTMRFVDDNVVDDMVMFVLSIIVIISVVAKFYVFAADVEIPVFVVVISGTLPTI